MFQNRFNLPYVAHPKPISETNTLRKKSKFVSSAINITVQNINAIAVGSKQYPRTQTLWKKDLKKSKSNFH